MIGKNSVLLKLEDDLLQEINALKKVYLEELKKVYLEELKKLTTVYNLQSFAKIYKPIHDVNKDGYSIDNNIQENIEFVNEAIAHQLTSFVMVEKLQMKLIEDISQKIKSSLRNYDEEELRLNVDKKQFEPKSLIGKVAKQLFNIDKKPKELIEAIKSTKIIQAKLEDSLKKINLIERKRSAASQYEFGQLLKMSSFEEINLEIKNRMKSSKIISSLADEMDTYRLSERYDKILERYPLKLEKLFTKHIGEDLSKQLIELKDKLDNQVLTLQQEANTMEHVLANISMIESDVIKGFLLKPMDFAKEKTSGFKNNMTEIYKPEERNKKFGALLASLLTSSPS